MKRIFSLSIICLFILVGTANALFFKINKSGCSERKGLVEVRYDLYLEEGDYGYLEHYVDVPDIPVGDKYTGKVDVMGEPVDIDDYNKWIASYPTKKQHNPFCCHFYQFEPTITDEEILIEGDKILKMVYENWQRSNLHLNKNPKPNFTTDANKITESKSRVQQIIQMDFTKVKSAGKYKIK